MRASEDAKGADSFIFEMEPQGDWTTQQYGFEAQDPDIETASAGHHRSRGNNVFGFEDLPANADDSFDFKADAGRETPPPPTDPIIIADIPEPLPQPVEGKVDDSDARDPILIADIPEPLPQPAGDVVKDLPPTDPIIIADIPHPDPQPVEPYVEAMGGYLI